MVVECLHQAKSGWYRQNKASVQLYTSFVANYEHVTNMACTISAPIANVSAHRDRPSDLLSFPINSLKSDDYEKKFTITIRGIVPD